MDKIELLSPAGNMEMLKYAISYGADAVYLAGTKFGARKYATNFSDGELVDAIKYAHSYGVKVYVTINTLIYENEISEFLSFVEFLYRHSVDAVLVQDFGMLNLLHNKFPNLELHASTQMHNNGHNMVSLLKKCGVKRVVLDREMPIEEIEQLSKEIETEAFCHGALCVSFSGQCLLSSYVLSRSGNRGECAGLCRLPYKLKCGETLTDSKYYLSLKDLCTVNYIDTMIDSGLSSLKIEGRMKSSEYVGYMTKIYRKLIDSHYATGIARISNEEMKNIRLLFNREFTKGFINGEENENIANIKSPNHIGIHLGKYIPYGKKIKLELQDDLYQGDVIRFVEDEKGMTLNFLYDKSGKLISYAQNKETVYVDNFLDIKYSGEIRKVSSIQLNKEIQNMPQRKISLQAAIKILAGEKITLEITDKKNKVIILGPVPEISKNKPIAKDNVLKQLNKTGNTIYNFEKIDVILNDNLFVNLRDLNELRRKGIEKIDEKRKRWNENLIINDFEIDMPNTARDFTLNVKIETESQYNVAKKYATNIFTDNDSLFKKLKSLGNISFIYEENSQKSDDIKYLIKDYGMLENVKEGDDIHTDYSLNVVNSYTVNSLCHLGAKTICLSPEASKTQILSLVKNSCGSILEVLIYGKLALMKMKYDPSKNGKYTYLIDRNNKSFLFKKSEKFCYLISDSSLNKIDELKIFYKAGIKNFRVDFYDEDANTCEKILSKIVEQKCDNNKLL